MFGAVS